MYAWFLETKLEGYSLKSAYHLMLIYFFLKSRHGEGTINRVMVRYLKLFPIVHSFGLVKWRRKQNTEFEKRIKYIFRFRLSFPPKKTVFRFVLKFVPIFVRAERVIKKARERSHTCLPCFVCEVIGFCYLLFSIPCKTTDYCFFRLLRFKFFCARF